MQELALQDIRVEGNSIFFTSYPTVGVLGLLSFTENVIGEDSEHYFEKKFRYSVNGIDFSEWMVLSNFNLSSLVFSSHQTVQFEVQYIKMQPLGNSQLDANNIVFQYNGEAVAPIESKFFDKTIFKQFFESNDSKVLNWYINVLNKLYKKGLVPDYCMRGTNTSQDKDFLQFWGSVAKFFAYYVIYARQFQNFHQSEALLFEFLEQRGLKISDSTTLEQMNLLMKDFYAETVKRGTVQIIEKEEDGAVVDGELLRLLWYKRRDEFVFNPRLSEHIGWNLGNSSPLYKGLYLHRNANKCPDLDLSNYVGANEVIGNVLKVSTSLKLAKKIKIDSNLDYEFSFFIKTAGTLSVKAIFYDENLNIVSSYSHKTNEIEDTFLDSVRLYRDDKFLPIKLFLYNWRKKSFAYDTTEIHRGVDLKTDVYAVWVDFEIIVSSESLISTLKMLPLQTPYSHGLIQTNNVIDAFIVNNNNYYSFTQLINHIKKYLIPYDSHLFTIDVKEFADEGVEEVPVLRNRWIGGRAYCQQSAWRGINPVCELMEISWVPEEETAYCQQI